MAHRPADVGCGALVSVSGRPAVVADDSVSSPIRLVRYRGCLESAWADELVVLGMDEFERLMAGEVRDAQSV